MVNSTPARIPLGAAPAVARGYVVLAVATLVVVAVLAATDPPLATSEAWGHAVVVAVLAVLLPVRLRSAGRGSVRALRAATAIAGVVLVVNVVEAVLPGVFPAWMRVDMAVTAVTALLLVVLLARVRPARG